MFQKSPWSVILLSFLILYLELCLIRFLPAHIRYLGYFSNFILIASFFGIGLGFLLSRIKLNLLPFFPLLLLLLIAATRVFGSTVNINSNEIIFLADEIYTSLIKIPTFILLPLLFVVITAVFSTLAQALGKYFLASKNPNQTYIFDILGSILGIVLFSVGSYLNFPSPVWLAIFAAVFLAVVPKKKIILALAAICLVVTIALTADFGTKNVFWSPYYRINLFLSDDKAQGHIFANNIIHQDFYKNIYAPGYYSIIYNSRFFPHQPPEKVLIIGAGTGQDTSAALAAGVKHIDAVEIDPIILQIGQRFHPEKPYSDPRVTLINNDGRNFFRNTKNTYDLIIFALTDSLIVSSTGGNIRLESFLFTREAFQEAKAHLNPQGAFVLYNDYRQNWLIQRLRDMLISTFNALPQEGGIGLSGRLFFIRSSQTKQPSLANVKLPSDDWPFFYLKKPSIPSLYLNTLMPIVLVALISVLIVIRKILPKKDLKWPRLTIFFFLGAAFSLLETKSIVQLNLLFGTTWFVNSIAFAGILLSVLIAALITLKWQFKRPYLWIALLSVSLGVQFILPISVLMVGNLPLRFILASLFFYLPIFFANLIFTNLFAKSKTAELDFGANLLGLVFGGVSEYIVLITGYWALTILVACFYLLALCIFKFIGGFKSFQGS